MVTAFFTLYIATFPSPTSPLLSFPLIIVHEFTYNLIYRGPNRSFPFSFLFINRLDRIIMNCFRTYAGSCFPFFYILFILLLYFLSLYLPSPIYLLSISFYFIIEQATNKPFWKKLVCFWHCTNENCSVPTSSVGINPNATVQAKQL